MIKPLQKNIINHIMARVLAQFLVVLGLAAGLGIAYGYSSAYAALWGGSICVAGSTYFAVRSVGRFNVVHPQQLVKGIYKAEFGKFALTTVLFFIAIKYFSVQPLPFFIGYIVAQAALVLAWWLGAQPRKVEQMKVT